MSGQTALGTSDSLGARLPFYAVSLHYTLLVCQSMVEHTATIVMTLFKTQ